MIEDVVVAVHQGIDEIPEADWDTLQSSHPEATPFTRWAFLEALEHSGAVRRRTGWEPRHLVVRRGGRIVAAAPAYLKHDSMADFSRDFAFAELAMRNGIRYYPKVTVTVPITPVTGARIFTAPGEPRAALVAVLVDAMHRLAEEEKAGGIHVLFQAEAETAELSAAGLHHRVGVQGHWINRGYGTVDDWLARFNAKKRHMIRRERAAPSGQGITIRTVRGPEIAADRTRWGRLVGELYGKQVSKIMWGAGFLNAKFFARLFDKMPEPLEVVVAEKKGRVVAGAFNMSGRTHLWGRYWGAVEEHPFLHFNVCLYHSVEDCIQRGLAVFEGGAGGEHKLHRGFDPSPTHSAHKFLHPALDRAIRDYLVQERSIRLADMAEND